ncbi:MAG: hypothetical protein E4H13_11475 [Calditrichales bacterium]|nr:MAG: hypothetical protein E4H13_11475 [Calditrichales bacterium]
MAGINKLLAIGFLICATSGLYAQINFSLEVASSYDDNLYRSPVPVSDLYSDFTFDLSYRPEDSNMSYY